MRLLEFSGEGELRFSENFVRNIPPYAILSHRWAADENEEVTYNDIVSGSWKGKAGYTKIEFCGRQAQKDGLRYFWVDTCCINKPDLSELSEAIRSMFAWYRDAAKCYVFLSDVSINGQDEGSPTKRGWKAAFRKSEWFTRGWTLQELLAPKMVQFFSLEGDFLGHRTNLAQTIHEITGIPVPALQGRALSHYGVDEKKRWAEGRRTKRPEDKAYCLLGIFDVSMSLRYGEGEEHEFARLEAKIEKAAKMQLTEDVDTWILENCYRTAKLRIKRLSGKELSMDLCYINLALVQQDHRTVQAADEMSVTRTASEFSIFSRLNVEERIEGTQLLLSSIFESREEPNGQSKLPRRIFIRGQAGIGKTTLCKKIVHDYTFAGLWRHRFNRILWIPLRMMKRQTQGYSIQNLFHEVFFWEHPDGNSLARKLHELITDSRAGQTLFVLDGLDEVSRGFQKDEDSFRLLLYLLNQPNVILMSRPHVNLPPGMEPCDLELETIGFYPEQVKTYVEKTIPDQHRAEQVQSYIDSHWLLQGLVRIPIQLDALCLTWDPIDGPGKVPETMTEVYQAIELKLWSKDIERLGKSVDSNLFHRAILHQRSRQKVERHAQVEIMLLEILAFTGLYNDIVDFDWEFLDIICKHFEDLDTLDEPEKVLQDVSFLRMSETLLESPRQYYHFLHLTFQEYFAARYFVRHWLASRNLRCLSLRTSRVETMSATGFLQRYKYPVHYDIFWRFVAGIFQSHGSELARFFQMLEDPCDLLGATHQRLIMHCLSEIHRSEDQDYFRKPLEDTLSQWLRWQCAFNHEARLAREMEFPENILSSVLQSENYGVKSLVLRALQARPWITSSVVSVAVPLLDDEELKHGVCGLLSQYRGPLAPEVLMKVAQLLDGKSRAQISALMTLCRQSSLPDEILEKVLAFLEKIALDRRISSLTRGLISFTTREVHPSLLTRFQKYLFTRLDSQDNGTRLAALRVCRYGNLTSGEMLQKLLAQLGDRDKDIRRAALLPFERNFSLSGEVLEQVANMLEDPEDQVVIAAVFALRGQLLSEDILERVTARMDDPNKALKLAVLETLASQASLPARVLEKVTEELKGKDSRVLTYTGHVLQAQACLPAEILEKMVDRLEDQNTDTAEAVLDALAGQYWTDDILDKVLSLFEDQNRIIRNAAYESVESHFDERRGPPLSKKLSRKMVGLLEHPDHATRMAALVALQHESPLSMEVFGKVTAQLTEQDWDLRVRALNVLQDQPSLPDDILQKVVALLADPDGDVRARALNVLQDQPSLPDDVLQKVMALLADPDSDVRGEALDIIQDQPSLPDDVLQKVVALLADHHEDVKKQALQIIDARGYLPVEIFLNPLCFQALYKRWLERSCEEQVSGYLIDSVFCLHSPESARYFHLDKEGALATFQRMIKEVQSSLDVPSAYHIENIR